MIIKDKEALASYSCVPQFARTIKTIIRNERHHRFRRGLLLVIKIVGRLAMPWNT